MKTSILFNPQRFFQFYKLEFKENKKALLVQVIAIYAALTIILLFKEYSLMDMFRATGNPYSANTGISNFFLVIFLFWSMMIIPGTANSMNNKNKRALYMMLPSSQLEKYLYRFTFSLILAPVAFYLLFCIADLTRVGIFSMIYPDYPIEFISLLSIAREMASYGIISTFLCGYLFLHSTFFLGSVIWSKSSFARTFGFIACYGVLLFYANVKFTQIFSSFLFFSTSNPDYIFYSGPEKNDLTSILELGMVLCALINWGLSYFRLKETELISNSI